MDAIQLNNVGLSHRYASSAIMITPNPPQVGLPTTLSLHLKNTDAQPITVSRIETQIAQFGMGVAWEHLPLIGPLTLPPDHVEEVTMQWTPLSGGHRCVRANIHIETLPNPVRIGRNLHVIESEAYKVHWLIPFRIGNPESERRPVVLELSTSVPEEVEVRLLVRAHALAAGEAIWLDPGEEVPARLLIHARTDAALESITSVEAFLAGTFLDGIQVVVRRPARVLNPLRDTPRSIEGTVHRGMLDEVLIGPR